ncbi:hypothetical protein DSCA_00490 [Desulfosarcina alkanivorans]|uniref:Secretin/TonB short N-terminal domain-containing protein n=1 Tax=Desulfosarcina alkanivorans TaxID=571177 RepID=A0A5K7YEG8_9BACT|nr:hypothetical protein DSCA_00490 [Desulfosarcina alkanivorans]
MCSFKKISVFLTTIVLLHMAATCCVIYALSSSLNLRLNDGKRTLQIEAKNADLKQVLWKLATVANITIEYPVALKKTITIHKDDISLRDVLKRMLKGVNYVIFYSGPNPNQVEISKVKVMGKAGRRKSKSIRQRQLAGRKKSYQRKIVSLKRRLSKIDANSRRGKSYLNRIKRLEKTIQQLERQMY